MLVCFRKLLDLWKERSSRQSEVRVYGSVNDWSLLSIDMNPIHLKKIHLMANIMVYTNRLTDNNAK